MWSDNIAEKDYLGFDVHANLIKGLIDDPKALPITIGVFGDWGSGKSSIMESLKKSYDDEKNKKTICLQFNGWTFEGYDDAKAALIEAILKSFEDNKDFKQEIKDKAKKLYKSVNWMRVLGFGIKNVAVPIVSAAVTGGFSIGPQIFEWIKGSASNSQNLIESIKDLDFEEFSEKYLKGGQTIDIKEQYQVVRKFRDDFKDLLNDAGVEKLIVLIDDLDRCLPDRIIDNLEAIKLFLNVEKTAFVIGADPRIVRDAIRHRYKDLIDRDDADENKRVVVDYLEKLIQVPYNLPKLSESEVETYITLLFCEDTLDEKEMELILKAFRDYRKDDRYSVYGIEKIKEILNSEETIKKLEAKVSLISKLSPLISGNLNGNPRQIKRFLNTFVLRRKLADAANLPDFKEDVLAKLMILEYAEPKRFSELYKWQLENKGYAIALEELESSNDQLELTIDRYKEWRTPTLKTWLNSQPMLANIDLRDYFWISRDSLNSMADIMTSPFVQSILTKLLVNGQPEKVIRQKIKEDVAIQPDNIQHEVYSLLVRKASDDTNTKHVYNVFEIMLDEGCQCEDEFRQLYSKTGKKPAIKEIAQRIIKNHQEFKDLKKS